MSRRVLIVDDDREMGELLDTDLRLRGFETHSYHTAEAAFEALRHTDVDVVLADLRLPGLNGIDLCATRQQLDGGLHVLLDYYPAGRF